MNNERLIVMFRQTDGSLACAVPFVETEEHRQATTTEATPTLLISVHNTDGSVTSVPPLESLTVEERRALARPLLKLFADRLASEFRSEFDNLHQ